MIFNKYFIFGIIFTEILLLVGVRLIYWGSVNEIPFSDMADYIRWGQSFAVGDWMLEGQFWGGYKPPGVPLLYAGMFFLSGGFDLDHLRWMQLLIFVLCLAFLSWQLVRDSGSLLTGMLLILVVAFTKSSVFWSYKLGTETLSESMLYLSLGVVMWVSRESCNAYRYIVLALVTTFATFVRPNSLPLIGVLLLFPLISAFRLEKMRALRCLVTYILSVVFFWGPWVVRNYEYCGQFVPLSTQGPYTFLWELGDVNLTDSVGRKVSVHVNQLQAEAPKKFANDCQASQHAMVLVKYWIQENIKNYPELVIRRLGRFVTERQIDLTSISRTQLHPLLDVLLFDKGEGQIVFATVIALALSFFYTWVRIISISLAASLIFSALFLGDARMFEPYIPLFLFVGLAPIIPLWQWIQRRSHII